GLSIHCIQVSVSERQGQSMPVLSSVAEVRSKEFGYPEEHETGRLRRLTPLPAAIHGRGGERNPFPSAPPITAAASPSVASRRNRHRTAPLDTSGVLAGALRSW